MTDRTVIDGGALLYVPAHQDRFLSNCLERGAAAVIVDLEDGVPAQERVQARSNLTRFLRTISSTNTTPVWVRVNSDPRLQTEDLDACDHERVDGVLVAKVETVDDLDNVVARGHRPGALIESARALRGLDPIAARVSFLALGQEDLLADLGATNDIEIAAVAGMHFDFIVAARAAGCSVAVGPVWTAIQDLPGLAMSTQNLRSLGYRHRCVIHPAHVETVNLKLRPTPSELDWARTLLDHAKQHGEVFVLEGQFVDLAVLRGAERIVSLAGGSV